MKVYREISGPSKAPQLDCVAFYKYDGSNFRAEWHKKRGWDKFGTRRTMIPLGDEKWGDMINVFMRTYSEDLAKIFTDDKDLKKREQFTVYGEYFGPNSFAGWHDPNDKEREIVIFDINVHKKGTILPRDFIKTFGHLKIPDVVYEGNFSKQFIQDVWDGKYVEGEGVVVKGVNPKTKKAQHGLWMAKCKTQKWMNELKSRAETNPDTFGRTLDDNAREQTV